MIQRAYDLFPQQLIDEFLALCAVNRNWVEIETTSTEDNNDGSYGGYKIWFNVPKLPPLMEDIYKEQQSLPYGGSGVTGMVPQRYRTTANDWTQFLACSRWLYDGPKVCRPCPERCEALQHIELRLRIDDLALPFPQLLVEFPPNTPGLAPFSSVMVSRVDGKNGDKLLVCCLFTPGHRDDVLSVVMDRPAPWVIDHSISTYGEECADLKDQARAALRVAINCCMMLTGSLSHLLPVEVINDRRLARENSPRGRRARHRLSLAVQVASFNQELEFRRTEGSHPQGEPTGRTLGPHWRRGHWRMQPCGTGRQDRKRILIPPVMVRRDLFVGNTSDTGVTYRE